MPNFVQSSLQKGLVLWMPVNGNARDATPNGNNGTVTDATLTTDRLGRANRAYSFNGSTARISIGNSSVLRPTLPLTISAWFRLTSIGSPVAIVTNDNGIASPNYAGAQLTIGAAGNLAAAFGDGSGTSASDRRSWSGSSLIQTNVWYHGAVVAIDITNNVVIYLNGVSDAATNVSGTASALGYTGNNGHIGAIGDGTTFPFPGDISDVRLYNRALTAAEIATLATLAN